MATITLFELNQMFGGKRVLVTHQKSHLGTYEGICKKIHQVPDCSENFDLEFEDGHRLFFSPEIVTETSVEGNFLHLGKATRKIELI